MQNKTLNMLSVIKILWCLCGASYNYNIRANDSYTSISLLINFDECIRVCICMSPEANFFSPVSFSLPVRILAIRPVLQENKRK